MPGENIIYYSLVFVIGVFLGIEVSRHYNEKTRNYSLGNIIQGVMISKSIHELREYTNQLDTLLKKIKTSSENLNEQIQRGEDIEGIIYESKDKNETEFTSIEDRDEKTIE